VPRGGIGGVARASGAGRPPPKGDLQRCSVAERARSQRYDPVRRLEVQALLAHELVRRGCIMSWGATTASAHLTIDENLLNGSLYAA